ncbi:Ca2+-binding RTX toxin-like protein [Inquilinus ginsengisoli]|uniref:Ca2+-binding RTX toxin-like protein n=1 Tax=Inquilinus ginsengisoli TaxID=363840 RepID=A0ABU1JVY3_9PROT|nr:calcium-binding protein [Inquilinus ginsengisoli]MDR6292478.1 Ca2+-binding RTX toxin-like protein [Inquilinus ginsengisoli]
MATVTGTSAGDFIHRAGDGHISNGGHEVTGVTTAADTISGAEGNDLIYGDDGADTISGGSGNDTIFGGQGADSLSGGVGYDVFSFEAASEIDGLTEQIDGGADIDRLDFAVGGARGPIDLSHATLTSVEELALNDNVVTLTAAQLGGFTTITAGFAIERLILSAAGTADLTGASIGGIDEIRGTAGNDIVILTGVANGQIVNGVGGNDTLTGGDGADSLNGGDGNDVLTGAAGGDTLVGGNGVDIIGGGDGNDTIRGGQGADTLTGGVGTDSFAFEQASDISGLAEHIDGGADADRLDFATFNASGAVDLSLAVLTGIEELDTAGNGSTVTLTAAQLGAFATITGGFGADILILSTAGTADLTGAAIGGIDEIRGSAGNDVVTLTAVANGQTVNGVAGNDMLTGGNGNDVLGGGDGADTLAGGNGNDTIDGGQGADTLSGGIGYDVFAFHQVSDISGLAERIDGGADVDRIDFTVNGATGPVNLSLAIIANVEELDLASNDVTLTAAQLDGFTRIIGGFGAERLILSAPGTVDLTGAVVAGIDEIRGSSGADTLVLTGIAEGQTVNGLDGADRIDGGNGNDALNGGLGDDTVRGGVGADVLNGGIGTDLAIYSESVLGVTVNLATRTGVGGNAQGDTLTDIENLIGSRSNDVLVGNAGANALLGSDGADVLTGAGGKDSLTGGIGADRFVYAAIGDSPVGAGADLITDFSHAQVDRIDLAGIDANTTLAGDQAFAFIGAAAFTHHAGELRATVAGAVTTVAGDVNGDGVADFSVTLTGALTLVAADFVL